MNNYKQILTKKKNFENNYKQKMLNAIPKMQALSNWICQTATLMTLEP